MKIMKRRITTVLLTFAIAITGINTPAGKVNAETKDVKTTSQTTAEAPAETVAPTATPAPTPTVVPTPAPTRAPVIGERRGDLDLPETMEIYTENGWEKIVWKMWDTCGDLILTPTGWHEEVVPDDISINTNADHVKGNTTDLDDGDTAEITKGFDTELSFKMKGDATPNWTSSNPEVVTIAKTKQNKDWKIAVLTGKNYGTSVVTAEYNGFKVISITIKVMKNEYREKYATQRAEASMVVSYNKKGNLVIKLKHIFKDPKLKEQLSYKSVNPFIRDEKNKKLILRKQKNFRLQVSLKKKISKRTIIVKKKDLKKKTQDLRKCNIYMGVAIIPKTK